MTTYTWLIDGLGCQSPDWHTDDPVVAEAVAALGFDVTVAVLVEVDVATARPPAAHARLWTWVAADWRRVEADALSTAMEMAGCHPHVVMPVAARIIDWK